MNEDSKNMRDVSRKSNTLRIARAAGTLHCLPSTSEAIVSGRLPKADPLGAARIAATQAAKNTSALIPYCHQVPLDVVDVTFEVKDAAVHIFSEVKAVWKTGVEMEALTAVAVAALTLYDMLKPIDDTMEIDAIRLEEKKGGKSDHHGEVTGLRVGVVVMSDSAALDRENDLSGKELKGRLEEMGLAVVEYRIIPDKAELIEQVLTGLCDDALLDLVITTGGTGAGPRDVTPETTRRLLQKELPGISEVLRAYGQERSPFAMLSRGVAGMRGKTLVINLPGSPAAVRDALESLFPWVLHALPIAKGARHEKAAE